MVTISNSVFIVCVGRLVINKVLLQIKWILSLNITLHVQIDQQIKKKMFTVYCFVNPSVKNWRVPHIQLSNYWSIYCIYCKVVKFPFWVSYSSKKATHLPFSRKQILYDTVQGSSNQTFWNTQEGKYKIRIGLRRKRFSLRFFNADTLVVFIKTDLTIL